MGSKASIAPPEVWREIDAALNAETEAWIDAVVGEMRKEPEGTPAASPAKLLRPFVPPSPYAKAFDLRKDKRGHRYCIDTDTGKRVDCPKEEVGSKPKRKAKVPEGYGDGIPALDRNKEPLRLIQEGDDKVLGHLLPYAIQDDRDATAWREEPFSTGRIVLDEAKLREAVGDEGLRNLIDRGWVSDATTVYHNGVGTTQYALTRAAKVAQALRQRNIREVRPPSTLADVDALIDLIGSVGGDVVEAVLNHVDPSQAAFKEYSTGSLHDLDKFLREMLYRSYNPVPVWERVAKDEVIQAKVKRLANLDEEGAQLSGERSEVTRKIKSLEEESSRVWRDSTLITNQLYPEEGPRVEGEARDLLMRELNKAGDKLTDLADQLTELHKQKTEIKRRQDATLIHNVLKVEDPSEVAIGDFDPAHTDDEKGGVHLARGWLRGKVAKGPGGEELPRYAILHDDSDVFGRGGPSAFYRSEGHAINVHTGMTSVWTNVHEMAHGIEYKMPGAQSAAQRFLAYRVKDEPLRSLKEVMPDSDYASWEEGRRDDFSKVAGERRAWYVGKKPVSNGGTEVVSMGVQMLFQNASGFAQLDPEFCGFCLGILDGRGRDVPVPEK